MVAAFAEDRSALRADHIGPGSRDTYDTGVGTFFSFAQQFGLPTNIFDCPLRQIHAVIEGFVLHLRRVPLQAATITQYISHLNQFLKLRDIEVALRGTQVQVTLQAAARQDVRACPKRLREKIPVVCSLMDLVFKDIQSTYAFDTHLRLTLSAVVATAYGLCCRIHEILYAGERRNKLGQLLPDHAVRSPHLSFSFPGDRRIYPASAPEDFPVGKRPYQFTCFHDSLKNWQGGSGTRAVAVNPSGVPFCLVQHVFDYVVAYPPPPRGHLFPETRDAVISMIVKRVVESQGLDGSRACPHAMRVGSETMVTALRHAAPGVSATQEQEHGMWRSAQGLRPYQRSALSSGAELSAALYDIEFMTVEYLRWYYMSEAIPSAIDTRA